MSCKICRRPVMPGKVYCSRHDSAYQNLEEGFEKWRYAIGVSWIEYFEKVSKVSGSGRWVKEIVKDILGGME